MKRKTIALIAHDNKKHEIVKWALANKEKLSKYDLCGTGTTAKLISEATGLTVKKYLSGPLGGDRQIGAKVSEVKIDIMIFFSGTHCGRSLTTPTSRRFCVLP